MKKIIVLYLAFCLLLCGCGSNGTASKEETSSSQADLSYSSHDTFEEISEDDTTEQMIEKMTLEQKIGQMLMLAIRSWKNERVSDTIPKEIENAIRENDIGNIILFAENFSSIESTVRLTESLQNSLNIGIPMFIGVDQEGGNVVRLSNGCSLIGNMALGAIGEEADAFAAGSITGEQLAALGINLNFSPSLDVNNNPQNPVINIRSFSEDPEIVSKLGVSMIKGLESQNITACAKHFPGHGDTATDSHHKLPLIDKSYDQIKSMELVPFQAAINNGINMIMTAHIQFPQVESDEKNGLVLPATLSKKIITDILKGDMGFNGVVITDSMQMDAIASNFTTEEACILAVNAGVDIILMPINLAEEKSIDALEKLIDALVSAVSSGEISEDRINDAVKRILTAKKEAKLWEKTELSLEEKISNAFETVGNSEHKAKERELASKAVTILENKTGSLFSGLTEGKLLLCVPSESIQRNVEFALNRIIEENSFSLTYEIKWYEDIKDTNTDNYDGIVIITDTSASWDVKNVLDIYDSVIKTDKKTAVISSRLPYDTALFTKADCLLACFCPKGNAPATEASAFGVNIVGAIEVLLGTAKAEGKLPVTIYKVSQKGKIDLNTIVYPKGYCA